MSNRGFLEKLLDGADVEWAPMSTAAEVRSGWGFPKAFQGRQVGSCPFYKVSDMNTVGNETTMAKANNYIDIEAVAKLGVKPAPEGSIIFPKIGAAIATNKKRLLSMPSAYDNNVMGLLPNKKVDFRFLFHWMKTVNLSRLASDSGAVPSIRKSDVETLLIPIPCPDDPEKSLAIQAEIVRVLDAFTELTAELTAELKARKKQYNHYRDQLLSFEDGDVEWKTLGEIFEIFAGGDAPKNAMSKEATEEFPVPILSNGIAENSLYGWTNKARVEKPSLTVSARGTIGWTSYREEPFFPIVRLIVLSPKTDINLKYAYYFMKTIEGNYKVPEAGIPQLTRPMIESTPFPVPFPNDPEKSLAEQARIVAILDKFDTLTTSLSEGLPREIDLRQKQYEYYRDLLLNFPRPEADSDEAA